jgi:hypothetical protein
MVGVSSNNNMYGSDYPAAFAYGGGRWLGVIQGGGLNNALRLVTSTNHFVNRTDLQSDTNGVLPTWLNSSNNSDNTRRLVFSGGNWILANPSTYAGMWGAIYVSTNGGTNWRAATNVSGGPSALAVSTNTPGVVVGVGAGGVTFRSTNNGLSWSTNTSGATANLNGLAFGNNRFVAVGDSGTVLTSTNNGVNWTVQASGVTENIPGVAFGTNSSGQGVFVLAGWNNAGTSSADGILWTPVNSNYFSQRPYGSSIAAGSRGFLVVNGIGDYYQSVALGTPSWDGSSVWNWNPSASLATPFSQTITVPRATGFTVMGLPPGLTHNPVAGSSSGAGVLTISGTPTQAGNYPITIYAYNASGIGSYQTIRISVAGTGGGSTVQPPWIVSLPDPIVAQAVAGKSGANVSFNGGQILNAVSASYSPPSGSFFKIGTNTVSVVATGSDGQTNSATFRVIVNP